MSLELDDPIILDIKLPTVDEIEKQNFYEQPDEWYIYNPPDRLSPDITEQRIKKEWNELQGQSAGFREELKQLEKAKGISVKDLLDKEALVQKKSEDIENLFGMFKLDRDIVKNNLKTPFRSYLYIVEALKQLPELQQIIDLYNQYRVTNKGDMIQYAFSYLSTVSKDRLEANLRASELIKQWLTKKELSQLLEMGYVDIKKGNKIYRVKEDYGDRVEVLRAKDMKEEYSLCGYVADYRVDSERESFVHPDHFLSKVIAIKSDPEYYEKNSNKYHTRGWSQPIS